MAPIIFAFGVVVGTILLIIFTEVLERPVLDEIKRIKYGSDSAKKLSTGLTQISLFLFWVIGR